MNLICLYCGKTAELIDSKAVYSKSYGLIYLCRDCNAYVGCHKGTDKPLGRLANAELRRWKKSAHNMFDVTWEKRHMSRCAAYEWLSKQMGLPPEQTHIGMFDIEQCKKVIKIMQEWRSKNLSSGVQNAVNG